MQPEYPIMEPVAVAAAEEDEEEEDDDDDAAVPPRPVKVPKPALAKDVPSVAREALVEVVDVAAAAAGLMGLGLVAAGM